jgi:hypothetical protein
MPHQHDRVGNLVDHLAHTLLVEPWVEADLSGLAHAPVDQGRWDIARLQEGRHLFPAPRSVKRAMYEHHGRWFCHQSPAHSGSAGEHQIEGGARSTAYCTSIDDVVVGCLLIKSLVGPADYVSACQAW